ncbi:MAG: biotin carboxylase N-terminal domain-containing protein [Armatimonadota bacterium]|nr:biotin carboxylase N-terminal domain-containing protein [Armatimonadota bacterium]MDR7453228.1 biotin carboxylase N-terminal domain-containing protein [Armatimonadota bacterium]MDR7455845.1 biotin carboxylase N-terminal domain-containing protein [Armatimonadota bacterium]MDR7497086.1 biotin carboxylase N-terminal domain-containing protein [Armatimonadota bacterium]MDR7511924.1 biotin carboxylase N-terminal domain-containing protein [Armatimonadota bacterium]
MFHTVLVANRGEIAVRIIRACRELGVRAVAVYSDADATAPHVALADEAVRLGPAPAAQSYLDGGRLIAAARATGAEAIHPGYGFLAEHAGFAAACRDAGLVFVGPPAEVIARLGDKAAARRLAEAAGVPPVPGYDEPGASDDAIRAAVARLGVPALLKAAGGGGGKGMRVVREAADLDVLLASARREAQAAFGDGRIIVERLLDRPRHVEVQVLADGRGQVVHLGERECSIQRRHQKIVEEAPSPAVDAALRERLGQAALAVARAAGYANAGTVEFLLDRAGRFYFLEVNTRLQVEHPVTELVTGVDLVAAQLRLAAGEPLRAVAGAPAVRGHAVECRVYAEDPARGFAPSPGRILHLAEPSWPHVRVDSGVRAGQEIPVHYDPILSKVAAWGPDRASAVRRLRAALDDYAVLGPTTTLPFLRAIVAHPAFAAAELSTAFLEEHFADWRPPAPSAEVAVVAAVLTAGAGEAGARTGWPAPPGAGRGAASAGSAGGDPASADPWVRLAGRRLP